MYGIGAGRTAALSQGHKCLASLTYKHALNFPRLPEVITFTASTQYALEPGVYEFTAYLVNGGTSGQSGTNGSFNNQVTGDYISGGMSGNGGSGGSSGTVRRGTAQRPTGNQLTVTVASAPGVSSVDAVTASALLANVAAGGAGGQGVAYAAYGYGKGAAGAPGSPGYAGLPSGITVAQSGGGGAGGDTNFNPVFAGSYGTCPASNGSGGGGGGGGGFYVMTVESYPRGFLAAPASGLPGKPGLVQLTYRQEF